MNNQSMRGAAAVAEAAASARRKTTGEPGIRIWPVATRVEPGEKDRLDLAREECRLYFERHIGHLPRLERSQYWGRVEINHQAYYSYEEVLATFAEQALATNTMLAKLEQIASLLTPSPVAMPRMPETLRRDTKAKFERQKVEKFEGPMVNVFAVLDGVSNERAAAAIAQLRKHGFDVATSDGVVGEVGMGGDWREAETRALEAAQALLVFIGPGGQRAHEGEIARAMASGKPVFPVLFDGAPPSFPEAFRSR